jgi:transposase
LEDWLPPDHLARLIWLAVCRLDLSGFERDLKTEKTEEGHRGHPAADPRLMVALWLYAFSQGVSSARELARLCVEHLAYIWLCGGVSMNYHSLADFRVKHESDLDELMTQVLTLLERAGLVKYEKVAQDGIRVRASAGAASFRREPTLKKHLEDARQVVAQLKLQVEPRPGSENEEETIPDDGGGDDNGGGSVRSRGQAARERAAIERLARLEGKKP